MPIATLARFVARAPEAEALAETREAWLVRGGEMSLATLPFGGIHDHEAGPAQRRDGVDDYVVELLPGDTPVAWR